MNEQELFEQSLKMIDELKTEIDNSSFIDGGLRIDVVSQCIEISMQHNISLNALLALNLHIPAMVLLRAQFEAVVKAYWILFLATNEDISKLNFSWTFEEQFEKDKFPMVSEMLEKLYTANLEAHHIIQHLLDFKKYHLKQLNSFVHSGKHSFTRHQIGFDQPMICALMRQSNNLATVAAQIMLKLTVPDKQKFIHKLIEKYRGCFFLDDDVDPEMKKRVDGYFT